MSVTITGPMTRVCAETLGRQRAYQWADLDRLQVAYIGPAYSLENFPVKSPHPEYPLMFVVNAQEQSFEGGLTRIQVTYEGKLLTKGQSSYITEPVTTESAVQGSRDFVVPFVEQIASVAYAPIGGNNPGAGSIRLDATTYSCGTQQVTIRYVGSQCSVRYQAYPRPGGLNYSGLGLGRVRWSVLSEYYGQKSVMGQGLPSAEAAGRLVWNISSEVPPIYAANMGMEIEQRGRWYNVTEVYAPTF